MAKRVFLKRSNVPGKLPGNKDDVGYGEVLVNYAAGEEFIGLKNSSNEYVRINAHPEAADIKFGGEHSDEGFTGTTVESSLQQIEKTIVENESVTSAALNDVKGKISDVETSVSNKVDKVDGKGLSTNDYTTEEKTKLGGIEVGAQVNVKPDWNAESGSTAEILNKPTIPSKASEIIFDGEHGDTGFTGDNVQNSIAQIESEIIKNELTISGSLNDINARISAIPEATVTGVMGDILSLESNKLVNATVSIDYGDATTESLNGKKAIKLLGKDNKVLSEIDASAFIKDGMIDGVAFDEKTHILTLTFNTEAGKESITVDLTELVDTYKAGNGLTLGEDGTFSVTDAIARVGTATGETPDTKDSDTIVGAKKYADDAVTTAKGTIDAYTVNGKKISENPTLKATDIVIESHSDTGFTGNTVEASIKQIETEMLANEKTIAGSLNDINSRLTTTSTDISGKVDKVEGSSLMTEAEHIKLSGISENAQVNAIESVKVNGVALSVAEDKSVDVLLNASGVTFDQSGHADYGFTGSTVQESVSQIESEIIKNEKTTSAALNNIKSALNDKVDVVTGKGLSSNDYTTEEKTKLAGIADNAEVNVITGITVNGEVVAPSEKVVALTIPTTEQLGDKNVIESVQLNGTALTVTDKSVDICPTASGISFDPTAHVNSGFTGENVQDVVAGIEQVIIDNELVISGSLNDLNERVDVKVDKVEGKQLSTEDYTTEEKTKLASLTPDLYCIKRTVETVLPDYASMGTTTGATSQTVTLDAGKFYIIGRVGSLTIDIPASASTDCLEYCCQFYVALDSFTLTMPSGIYWQNGMAPTFEGNTCCQMVIVNNCATIGTYKAS